MPDDAISNSETLQPNFGFILHEFDPVSRRVVRSFESSYKKLINCLYAVRFNEACIRENLLPRYTNIYIYASFVNPRPVGGGGPKGPPPVFPEWPKNGGAQRRQILHT